MSKGKASPIRRPRTTAAVPRQPLLVLVREELRDALHRKYRAGDRLPSEPDLAATYGVSRPTIREVLSGLERDGSVRRVHGVGTFVNDEAIKVTSTVDIDLGVTEAVEAARRRLGVRILASARQVPPADVAGELALAGDEEVLWIERLILADETPAAYVVDAVPERIASIARQPYSGGSVYRFLEEACGLSLLGGAARISAVSADRRQSRLLRVPLGSALLRLKQVEHTKDEVACLFSLEHYVPSVFDLTIRRTRHGRGADR
jgi:DNA-binding GntR family transcriptional regulator